jgi:molecular chaperone HscB
MNRYANKSKEEKYNSEHWSPLVNEVYTTLLEPMKRSLYMLKIHGNPMLERELVPLLDANFLAEIMELNDEVAEADSADDVSGIMEAVKAVLDRYYSDLDKKFTAGNIKEAKFIVAKMQYYHNLKDKLKEKEREFGIIH